MAKNWIKKAVGKNKGKFGAKAEHAGMSTAAYAEKEKHAPGALGKEARMAKTLMGMHHKRKKLYDNPRSHSKED